MGDAAGAHWPLRVAMVEVEDGATELLEDVVTWLIVEEVEDLVELLDEVVT